MKRLSNAAEKLGYRIDSRFEGYKHEIVDNGHRTMDSGRILEIGYSGIYKVNYDYNPDTNSYLRWRSGKEEIDKNNGKQVEVKNIVVMRAASRQIEGDYNDVDIEGEGEAIYYFNGDEVKGTWQKDKSNFESKLYFFDENREEIKFAPGKIWIEVVEPYQEINFR